MTTNAFIGGLTVKIGNAGSPETFTEIPECIDLPDLGAENAQVDATHFGSGGTREYISGLADGKEITMVFHYQIAQTQLDLLVANTVAKTTTNLQVIITDGTQTITFSFAYVPLEWSLSPSLDGTNNINFRGKVSGAISQAVT